MTRVTLALLGTGLLITIGIVVAIALARGYEFNPTTGQLSGTGILVATSDPIGAEVLIDGQLKTATNNSLNLPPGQYSIKLQLDGYSSWEKKVEIKNEEVYKTNAFLFPKVPDLRPLTLTGSLNPTNSSDGTKIAYGVASASAERNGVWVLDMGRSNIPAPLPSGGDFRQIFVDTQILKLSQAKFLWSPDTKQIIVYTGLDAPQISTTSATTSPLEAKPIPNSGLVYLLNSDQLNSNLIPLTQIQINRTLTDWEILTKNNYQAKMLKLNPILNSFLTQNSKDIRFSPDQTKILYTATTSATLGVIQKSYLPGKNSTSETRTIIPGNLYSYDLKEDTNYEIDKCKVSTVTCSWFPSSRHILIFSSNEISIMEYDGTNLATVYAGPFIDSIVYAWPNWSKIVILTSLNQISGFGENLYTINLR